jgi:hypothetical protein
MTEQHKLTPPPHFLAPIFFIEALGPITVWATEESWEGKHRTESAWVKVYEQTHESSWRTFVELKFQEKVIIPRGNSVGMYVHSKRRGDEAIVYDNQRSRFTHTDDFIKVVV